MGGPPGAPGQRVGECAGAAGAAGVVRLGVRVRSPQGLHARPAARIVQVACRFAARISLDRGGTRANAKDLLDLLALAAPFDAELLLEAAGADAPEAAAALAALFEDLGREGA
jgi:phosphotransferase system HPr (HPr) family protein